MKFQKLETKYFVKLSLIFFKGIDEDTHRLLKKQLESLQQEYNSLKGDTGDFEALNDESAKVLSDIKGKCTSYFVSPLRYSLEFVSLESSINDITSEGKGDNGSKTRIKEFHDRE